MWGNMIIKSLSGKTIYQSEKRTIKAALEEGIRNNVDFSHADFRHAKLSNGCCDGLIARDACFWGADLANANIGFADLRDADMRCANLKDCCLADSHLAGADLRGAYFSQTIVDAAVLDGILASCPSFWSLDLAAAASFKGAVFCHKGERDIVLRRLPWIVDGPGQRLVIHENQCLLGAEFYDGGLMPLALEQSLSHLRVVADRLLRGSISHNAFRPIPKRGAARQVP